MYKLIFLLFLSIGTFAQADTIKIKVGDQGANQAAIELPQRAQSKDSVRQAFGEPESKTEAKGEPPISSWAYPDFVVYFESDYVIHSVRKHKKSGTEASP
jgi:hypothetical protein